MSGGGSQKVSSTTNTVAEPWSGVQPYLKDMYGMTAKQMAVPGQYFPYQTYAQQSPLTAEGQQALLRFAGNALPGYISTGNNLLQSMAGAADVANNPYVQNMLAQQGNTLAQQLREQYLPSIRSGASLAGQYGSSRQGIAEGQAIGDTASALANAAAQTQLGAYQQGLAQQQAAAQYLPAMIQMGMMPSQILGQVGGAQEAYQQQQIADAMNRFNYYQQEPWQRLNYANSIFSGVPWGQSGTTTGTQPGTSTAANLLGGGMMGLGLYNQLSNAGLFGSASSWAPTAGGMFGGSTIPNMGSFMYY